MTIISSPAPRTIYPHTYLNDDLCVLCFQRTFDLAETTDRRVSPTGERITTCAYCYRATVAGLPTLRPAGPELGDLWERLARLSVNEEISEATVTRALATLAPALTPQDAAGAFALLGDALQFRQAIHDGDITTCEVEPELADPGLLADVAERQVGDARAVLVGGAA